MMPAPTSIFFAFTIALIAVLINQGIIELKFSPKKLSLAIKKAKKTFANNINNNNQNANTQKSHEDYNVNDDSSVASQADAPDLLKKHSNLFNKKEILKVTENVYAAIGFGLANSLLFDDPTSEEGIVMIDAMESEEAMQEVLDAFNKEQPQIFKSRADPTKRRQVQLLVYTHGHQDHIFGSRVINASRILSHELTKKMMTHSPVTGPITYTRGMRQFGVFVPTESFINSGIGPELRTGENVPHKNRGDASNNENQDTSSYTSRPVLPTETFSTSSHSVKVGNNLHLDIYHCPGETPDQIVIHFPKIGLLVASDNIYTSYPNIYAIRGTPSRDATIWAKCLGDTMRGLKSKILVPLHTRPVYGEEEIFDLLTDYRDGIQFTHDQTVFHMNRGLYPNQIVQKLRRLPDHLQDHPWLQPFYGDISKASRAIFTHYMGWFSGNAVDLQPSAPGSFAREVVTKLSTPKDIVARAQQLLDEAEKMKIATATTSDKSSSYDLKREKAQLALEIISLVLDSSSDSSGEDQKQQQQSIDSELLETASKLSTKCYSVLASLSIPATGRNYYTTFSLEQQGELDLRITQNVMKNGLAAVETGLHLLEAMSVNLDIETSDDADWLVNFDFTDTKESFYFHIRRGVTDIIPAEKKDKLLKKGKKVDLKIGTTVKTWIQLMTKERSPVALLASKEIDIKEGSLTEMTKFRTFFSNPRD